MKPQQDVIELPGKHSLRIRAEKAEAQRDELLAVLSDMVQMRWFVMAYEGRAFDKPRMIAMLDRADAAIAKAERK